MEATTNYLRASDVRQDIIQNRPLLIVNDYLMVCTTLAGGCTGILIANGLYRAFQSACRSDYANYFVNKTVEILCRREANMIAFSALLGSFGALDYLIQKENQIIDREKAAMLLLGDNDTIITKSKYAELRKIMGLNLSADLHERFKVPFDKELHKVKD